MTLPSLRPQKMAMLVAQQIVAEITESGKQPGDRLPAEHLMLEKYGVGRGTLRESLRILELQGVILLKAGSGGGPIVQKPDSSVLANSLTLLLQFEKLPFQTIIETRIGLEPMMARLAAERRSPKLMLELKNNVDALRDNLENDVAFHLESERFHAIIAQASGNVIFGYLISALLGILDGTAVGIEYPAHEKQASCDIHQEIYDAIVAGDSKLAERLMLNHIKAHAHYAKMNYPAALSTPIAWTTKGH